ncbi:leucine rich adaptor protein 1 [Megalops cyprinoides]|uniref:leucine rich adaptor protein 1 n=1 Tax=Megalops cyprinoides TaxID=118141 RepID=UPI001863F906|nr:leucine rich adaptor protein 1 [Megalops cyprinoides]
MEESSVNETIPDLKDLELKIGRKTPEGLLKWMREDASHRGDSMFQAQEEEDLGRKGLAEKIRDLKLEMAHLRSVDVKILQQLVAVHEGIEAVKWLLEERSTLTSRCSSLTSSQYSLGEGPDTSLRGSWSSLQDPNDKLDNISIGSYLDTLADDMDEYCPSSSESVLCSTPLGTEVSDRTGGAAGSPLVRSERPKEEPPVWAKFAADTSKAPESGRVASASKDAGQTQPGRSNGFPDKAGRQGGAPESARACLAEKLGKSQSPKLKPYKNGKIDLEGCKLNSKMHLEYDAHWRWVQSQDDVTFL